MSLFEEAIMDMVRAAIKKEVGGTEKGMRPWNRENAKWEKGEEELLIQRVSLFIDHCALAHRRKRGGIIARLNKLLKEQRLCGLRSGSTTYGSSRK